MSCNDRAPAAASRRRLTTVLAILAVVGLTPVGVDVLQEVCRSPAWTRSSSRDEADGIVPKGVPIFEQTNPAVANLEPALLKALTAAARNAAGDGVKIVINSGWRSPRRQAQLFREAVSEYGSKEAAARWVATAETSSHVRGDAVDIGPEEARTWLSRYGAAHGLCQIYRNEPWHYELRPAVGRRGCPPLYADPTRDPRSGSLTAK